MSKKQKVDDEENQTLAAQVKKRKEREDSPRRSKKPCPKRDVSKVQCFNCRKMGHYAAQCSHKHGREKKKKHHAHAT